MDQLVADIRAARSSLAAAGPPRERTPGDFERVSLPAADADVLTSVLRSEQVHSVAEIGLAYGASALAVAEALATQSGSITHVIIDPFQDQFDNVGIELLADVGWDEKCDFLPEESQFALPRLVIEDTAVDAAFVDGSHHFHNVFVDLYFLQRLVSPGGLVVLDDCQWPSVATAADYFVSNLGWREADLPSSTRLTAFRLPDPPAHPRFDQFEPFGAGRPGYRPAGAPP